MALPRVLGLHPAELLRTAFERLTLTGFGRISIGSFSVLFLFIPAERQISLFYLSPKINNKTTQIRDNHILTPKTGLTPLYATYGSERAIYCHDNNVATAMCDVFQKIV